MIKLFPAIIALVIVSIPGTSVVHAQDVFQPGVQQQADVGRYNAKGERLSSRSPSHVLANADKTHFTLEDWAQKILDEKRKPDQMKAANAFLAVIRAVDFDSNPGLKTSIMDIVHKLYDSDSEIAKAIAIDVIFYEFFRGEFTDLIIEASKSESPEIKWRAFRALSTTTNISGLNKVYENALFDNKEHPRVRLFAVAGLTRKLAMGDESVIGSLEKAHKTVKVPEVKKEIDRAFKDYYSRTN